MTTAGRMASKSVIHTVGPVYGKGGREQQDLLAACYRNSLQLLVEKGLETIAFPAISTGVYGYPPAEAAEVSSRAIAQFLNSDRSRQKVREVRLVFFSQGDAETFLRHHAFEE
jgi:O-acetyl-ADP-ribose deacetylase (regulator of RNase III)